MRKLWLMLLMFTTFVPIVSADRDLAVTIYNQDFGVVKDARTFQVQQGTGQLIFTEVASRIDPTSVQVTNRTNPEFTLSEQNFENNLVSVERLMEKMIDLPITVLFKDGKSFTGRLLSAEDQSIILGSEREIRMIQRNDHFSQILLPELPEGLLLRPTLVWKVHSPAAGEDTIELTYQSAGMNWSADYNVMLNADRQTLDINGWVTIVNQSGARYPDTGLKLVAGEVHKVAPEPEMFMDSLVMKTMERAAAPPPGFEERAFADYHLYDLGRRTTIEDNQTKQIELFDVQDVGYSTHYLFDEPSVRFIPQMGRRVPIEPDGEAARPLSVVVTFENRRENQLGIPLPAGTVRLYQQDRDEVDHLIGTDRIEHTPRNEEIELTVGQAFDVIGSRRMDASARISEQVFTQDFVIRIRNHKDRAVPVVVRERLMGHMNWTIENESHPFEKADFQTIEFRFDIEPNREELVRYRVRYQTYTW